MPSGERLRRREARHAWQAVHEGTAARRPPTEKEVHGMVQELFAALDARSMQPFGIARLGALELDGLHKAPEAVPWSRHLTILDYAAWRGRDIAIRALCAAGADFSEGRIGFAVRAAMPSPYAVWVARAAARMRQAGARAHGECCCGAEASLLFAPCQHQVCPDCVWRAFQEHISGSCTIELRCPRCDATFADPAVDHEHVKRGGRHLPLYEIAKGGWSCGSCEYVNKKSDDDCRNCGMNFCQKPAAAGAIQSDAAVPELSKPPPPAVCPAKGGLGMCLEGLGRLWRSVEPACWTRWRFARSLQARRAASLAGWMALPEDLTPRSAKKPALRAMSAAACATSTLGATRAHRSTHLLRAAERGDSRRIAALVEAGVDLGGRNEYGQTALFLAAWGGHASVVDVLLESGADPADHSNGGASPYTIAAAQGTEEVLAHFKRHAGRTGIPLGRGRVSVPSSPASAPSFLTGRGQVTPLRVPEGVPGLACYVDGAFTEEFLLRLEALFRSLPAAPKDGVAPSRQARGTWAAPKGDRSRQDAAPWRSYFCDAEARIVQVMAAALQGEAGVSSSTPSPSMRPDDGQRPPCTKACMHMRFLHYADVGGYLPAHTDLGRVEGGQRSSHTFLLYLAGGDQPGAGGETVLLERLEQTAPAVAAVSPKRGRLLVYPHMYPHRASPVLIPPKLLLRGEMY